MNFKYFVVLMLISVFFIACSADKTSIRKNYPPHIVLGVCSEDNDMSPRQKPGKTVTATYCSDDARSPGSDSLEGVRPSAAYIADIFNSFLPEEKRKKKDKNFDYYVAQNAETITFIDDSSGFFSIAHMPDRLSAEVLDFEFFVRDDSVSGGTDIYEFHAENGKYKISRLGSPINTMFWDSHPFVLTDSSGNLAMFWASDRNSPYSFIVNTEGKKNKFGHTDIFYAFRDAKGNWGSATALSDELGTVNSLSNDESPYVYCQCFGTLMFFASNRAGAGNTEEEKYNDYDIYYTRINIDFVSQKVTFPENPQPVMLPKGTNQINTNAKEFFPLISRPYSEAPPENYLYFSSDRYSKDEKGIVYLNEGKLDVYRLPVDGIECKAPRIVYNFVIADSANPETSVLAPILNFYELGADGGRKLVKSFNSNRGTVELEPWHRYVAEGGSTHMNISCEPGKDSTLWHYYIRNIKLARIDTVEKASTIEYEKLKTREIVKFRDSVYSMECSPEELAALKADKTVKILSVLKKDEDYIVDFSQRERYIEKVPVDTLTRTSKINVKELKYIYDTTFTVADANNLNQSVITKNTGFVSAPNANEDIYINDTVFLWDKYFVYPPCQWKYVRHEVDYRRNVPYFQTCFWEVNTGANLTKHLSEFQRKGTKYTRASFIELHPNNYYFGYLRGHSSGKFRNRAAKYRKFANAVDANIAEMANEIGGSILQQFGAYDSLVTNGNKIIIMIDAYSDIRSIEGNQARFISRDGKPVKYLSVSYDTASLSIGRIAPVEVQPDAPLTGENNDLLSKLRVFFGYSEIVKKLREYPIFKDYEDRGMVLLPESVSSENEFWEKFDKSKIIFMIEGKQRDMSVEPKIEGYVGKQGDFASLDTVRRINLIVQRVVANGRTLTKPDCCRSTPSIPEFRKPEEE